MEKSREAVDDGLIVDEHVRGTFGGGHQMEEGKSLGTLGVLDQVLDSSRIIEPMTFSPKDGVSCSSEQRVGLMGARSVGGRVGPVRCRGVVVVGGVVVGLGPRTWWSRDRLGQWIGGQLLLQVEEFRVLVDKTAVPCVRR